MSGHVDLGQIIIACLIGIVGWFLRKEIVGFGKRLDRHEDVLLTMTGTVSRVVGEVEMLMRVVVTSEDRREVRELSRERDAQRRRELP